MGTPPLWSPRRLQSTPSSPALQAAFVGVAGVFGQEIVLTLGHVERRQDPSPSVVATRVDELTTSNRGTWDGRPGDDVGNSTGDRASGNGSALIGAMDRPARSRSGSKSRNMRLRTDGHSHSANKPSPRFAAKRQGDGVLHLSQTPGASSRHRSKIGRPFGNPNA